VTRWLKSDAAKAWQAHAVGELLTQRPTMRPIDTPVQLEILLRGPLAHPHSVDGDNAEGAILDALRAAKILADDRPTIVRSVRWIWTEAPAWSVVVEVAPFGYSPGYVPHHRRRETFLERASREANA
jgi:Holliday junction resolvase RusA-like endonuclease